jgi:type II secretory pathway pseudopilin PulG
VVIAKEYQYLKYMNRGMTLIETIIYISLLSILILGVFSSIMFSISNMNKDVNFSEDNYDLLIQNFYE